MRQAESKWLAIISSWLAVAAIALGLTAGFPQFDADFLGFCAVFLPVLRGFSCRFCAGLTVLLWLSTGTIQTTFAQAAGQFLPLPGLSRLSGAEIRLERENWLFVQKRPLGASGSGGHGAL